MVVLLMLFAATGTLLFGAFGITLQRFAPRRARLWFVAIDMLHGERRTQEGREELIEGQAKEAVALTPLAIPMLAGPGAISTAIVVSGTGSRGGGDPRGPWCDHPLGLDIIPGPPSGQATPPPARPHRDPSGGDPS